MPPRKSKATSHQVVRKESTDAETQTTEDFLQIAEYEEKIRLLEEEIKILKVNGTNNLFEIPPSTHGLRFTTIRKSVKISSPSSASKIKGCNCKGNCSTRICGCVKKNKGCFEFCKCNNAMCQNQEPEKENIGVQHPALTVNDEDALEKLGNLTLDVEKSGQKNRSIFSPIDQRSSTNAAQASPNFLEKSKRKLFNQNHALLDIDTEDNEELDVETKKEKIAKNNILKSPMLRQSRIPRCTSSENEKIIRPTPNDTEEMHIEMENENPPIATFKRRKNRRNRRDGNVNNDDHEALKPQRNPGKSRLPKQKGHLKDNNAEKEVSTSTVTKTQRSPINKHSTDDTEITTEVSPKISRKNLLTNRNVSTRSRRGVSNENTYIDEEVPARSSKQETKMDCSPIIKQSPANKKVISDDESQKLSSQDESLKNEMLEEPQMASVTNPRSSKIQANSNEENSSKNNLLQVPSAIMTRSRSRSSSAESLRNFKASTKVIHSPPSNNWVNPKKHTEILQVAIAALEQTGFGNKLNKESDISATSSCGSNNDAELRSNSSELDTTNNMDDLMEKSIHPMMPKRQLPRSPVIISQAVIQPDSKRFSPPKKELVVEHIDWEQHQKELVPCPKCKRRFFPHRIEKHQMSCKKF